MGTQQRKIFLVFQSRFSIHRITNCMGKHASLRIASGLCSVCGYFCCGKYFAVCRYNIPTDHMIRKQILQGIIRTVDKRFTFTYLKIDKINHHRQKHCQEQIHNNKKFFVTFLCLFLFSSHSFLPLLRFCSFFCVRPSNCMMYSPCIMPNTIIVDNRELPP